MKKQLIGGFASILVLTIVISSVQPTHAVSYYEPNSSVSKYLEKVVVKPYSAKKDTWSYIVKACATTHNLAIAGVILKSDIDQQVLGVNKIIKKGNCSQYGAVMKAKDGSTLGAELIQKHEAVQRMEQILKDKSSLSTIQRNTLMKEFMNLYTMIGIMPKL